MYTIALPAISQLNTAQLDIPIGSWRTHFSYRAGQIVKVAEEKVYCASQQGLYYYDKQDQSLNILSKLDGLSDAGISALDYDSDSQVLAIGYSSAILDFVSGEVISSFELLSTTEAEEHIHRIEINGSYAYLATSEGVRVVKFISEGELDPEIKESYTRLSKEGEKLAVYDIALTQDSIYLATEEGVISNALALSVNRQDFATWKRFDEASGLPNAPSRHIEQQNQKVYAAVDSYGVYSLQDGVWKPNSLTSQSQFTDLHAQSDVLVAATKASVFMLTDQVYELSIRGVNSVAIDESGILWVANENEGLIKTDGQQKESLYPNGPSLNTISSLHYEGEQIFALADTSKAAFSTFKEGRWHTYLPEQLNSLWNETQTSTLTDVAYLEAENTYYFTASANGMLGWDAEGNFSKIASPFIEGELVNSLQSVKNGLWVASYRANPLLRYYEALDKTWKEYSLNEFANSYPNGLVVTENGLAWMPSSLNGTDKLSNDIIIYDTQENSSANLKGIADRANLPGSLFTGLRLDLEEALWLSGNEGISFISYPNTIDAVVDVTKPIFENQYLLFGKYVSSIAVDGGNRKWVGTNNGIWLFEDTGEDLLYHFTISNSPLPSNTIIDIAIDSSNGEVFILTDKGLVSFRGTASRGAPLHQEVKIFPNPVPPAFNGHVGIEGLVSDAELKLTTASGTLVRSLRAEGGTAVWDIKDYQGQRVGTGVYLLFSASEDGSQTFIGKIAVIN
ncbi:hypothetical protein PZB74_08985 [Porifericola rhodea]|uniref:type IX secretion system anionic LPS delivery protein PorZ n=1 Tax=Porifericola rhodea TaxID=930972 RepID=UPI002665E9F2|nr:hypothetical protein [Porifericola rhodea]WKN33465.1 hypothetical protein PZB74_08985 [Porifericola rhodea]